MDCLVLLNVVSILGRLERRGCRFRSSSNLRPSSNRETSSIDRSRESLSRCTGNDPRGVLQRTRGYILLRSHTLRDNRTLFVRSRHFDSSSGFRRRSTTFPFPIRRRCLSANVRRIGLQMRIGRRRRTPAFLPNSTLVNRNIGQFDRGKERRVSNDFPRDRAISDEHRPRQERFRRRAADQSLDGRPRSTGAEKAKEQGYGIRLGHIEGGKSLT